MQLYNTLTRTVEPLLDGDVVAGERPFTMYVCGPTVQDVPHFGHARAALVPDVLRRYLEWRGVRVLQVRNITDVEDKIIARAAEEGRDPAEVSEAYSRVYEREMERLHILPPHIAPRATGHIVEMIELIQRLLEVSSAYTVDGDVYFRVRSFPAYGRLSGRDIDELRAGARVEADERKDDPLDFALWKAAKPGEPSWASPWGRGRPGWHIECSAMAAKYLGPAFDLHTGGIDLVFPHHENEIAQSEAATGRTFARSWLHNGLLQIEGVKMSKSLGNFITLADALDEHGPDVLRLLYLQAHYRSPVSFSAERLGEARRSLERLRGLVRSCAPVGGVGDVEPDDEAVAAFRAAMEDDFGTPAALAVVFDLVTAGHAAHERGDERRAARAAASVVALTGVLGLDVSADEPDDASLDVLVEELLTLRAEARARRDFAIGDRIRDALASAGILVEDTPQGQRWHRR